MRGGPIQEVPVRHVPRIPKRPPESEPEADATADDERVPLGDESAHPGATAAPGWGSPDEPSSDARRRQIWGEAGFARPVPAPRASEPLLFLPAAVTATVLVLCAIHGARAFISPLRDEWLVITFAFVPARYGEIYTGFPGGAAGDVWTFLTYALLHGNTVHLITNCVWLVAFGAAVARRFGPARYYALFAAAAVGGALMHLVLHFGEPIPVVGASAGIAGLMAAAARFVFERGGPMGPRRAEPSAYRTPARTLRETLRNRSAVAFIAIFFAINLALGFTSNVSGGLAVAWEAHLGGFLVGLLAFRWFDPVAR